MLFLFRTTTTTPFLLAQGNLREKKEKIQVAVYKYTVGGSKQYNE
jgi:hypothetical protein